jgi:hypothetical protein
VVSAPSVVDAIVPGNLGTCSADVGASCGGSNAIACSQLVSGFSSNVCQKFASDTTGVCDTMGVCIKTDTNRCFTNGVPTSALLTCGSVQCVNSSGCQPRINTSGVTLDQVCLVNQNVAACADIDCRTTVRGWNGARCERYNMIHDGFCLGTATCDTDIARCATAPNVALTTAATCPSTQCRDLTKCTANSDASQADTVAKVCLLNVVSSACSTYTCLNQLAGLSGAQCLQYDRDGVGFCTSGGVCETTCDTAFQQTTSVRRQCASVGCVRPGVCTKGAARTTINSLSDLCFVNMEQGTCAIGGRCDATGLCKFEDNGGPCTIDDNCVSKFCWRPVGVAQMTNNGKCCASRCDLDCNECSTGACTVRTGETCDQPPARTPAALIDCQNRIKGWSGNQCQKYSLSTSKQCTSGALCSSDPALCAANMTTGAASHLSPCTSSQCRKACTAGDATGAVGQSNVCFFNEDQAACPDIDCSSLVSGWSGATCQKYTNDHLGFCENDVGGVFGRCSVKESLCTAVNSAGDLVAHRTCLSSQCVIASRCQAGTTVASQMALTDVCESSKVINACPSIQCTSASKGWNGLACERYSADHPGYCLASTACADTSDYARCSLDAGMLNGGAGISGIAEFSCGSLECRRTNLCQQNALRPASRTTVCFTDEAQSLCPDVNARSSRRVGSTTRATATTQATRAGALATHRATRLRRVARSPALTTVAQTCPSTACRNPAVCQQNAPLSSSDTLAEACLLNADVAGCNPPTTVPCNKFLTGWNGRTCERYNRASSGRCDANGACITTCAQIPQQAVVPHVSCGHVGCVRPGTCPVGGNLDNSTSVDSLCFTDGVRHNCPVGATCDASGDCVYVSDGKACADGYRLHFGLLREAAGRVLQPPPAATSARSACSVGQVSGEDWWSVLVRRQVHQAIKGVNPALQSQCQRFENDRKGVCLQRACAATHSTFVSAAPACLCRSAVRHRAASRATR